MRCAAGLAQLGFHQFIANIKADGGSTLFRRAGPPTGELLEFQPQVQEHTGELFSLFGVDSNGFITLERFVERVVRRQLPAEEAEPPADVSRDAPSWTVAPRDTARPHDAEQPQPSLTNTQLSMQQHQREVTATMAPAPSATPPAVSGIGGAGWADAESYVARLAELEQVADAHDSSIAAATVARYPHEASPAPAAAGSREMPSMSFAPAAAESYGWAAQRQGVQQGYAPGGRGPEAGDDGASVSVSGGSVSVSDYSDFEAASTGTERRQQHQHQQRQQQQTQTQRAAELAHRRQAENLSPTREVDEERAYSRAHESLNSLEAQLDSTAISRMGDHPVPSSRGMVVGMRVATAGTAGTAATPDRRAPGYGYSDDGGGGGGGGGAISSNAATRRGTPHAAASSAPRVAPAYDTATDTSTVAEITERIGKQQQSSDYHSEQQMQWARVGGGGGGSGSSAVSTRLRGGAGALVDMKESVTVLQRGLLRYGGESRWQPAFDSVTIGADGQQQQQQQQQPGRAGAGLLKSEFVALVRREQATTGLSAEVVSDETLSSLADIFDLNGDGLLSFDEFRALLHYRPLT
jgi:hypothetical protein